MEVYTIALMVLFAVLAVTEAQSLGKSNAPELVYCPCVPRKGDCGRGLRVGQCEKKNIKCKVPCGWKKEFGADCKYHFDDWSECDATTGSKTRTGRLKKALFNAVCQRTVSVSKPCKKQPKPTPETGPKPTGVVTLMSEADKAYIVNRHNELRRGVKPTASNMLKMSWSDEAAANAQRWADKSQCAFKHSNREDRKISTSGCGENIAMAHSHTESSWADKIQMWYDEVKDWKYGEGSVNGGVVGHFTQVVWYRSNQIGCGVAHCPDAKYKYIYVCQYCSPGNYQYTHPYKEGPACGDCPNDCDDKLCTNPCPYADKWTNCADLGEWGCKKGKCDASCKCTSGEII